MKTYTRITSLVVKEFLTLFRDPKGRMVLIIPPLLQLFIFAFAATLEVKNVSIGIYNQDLGKHSQELIQRFSGSRTFVHIHSFHRAEEMKDAIDRQTIAAGISIPSTFSRNMELKTNTQIQLLLDGRRSNAVQIINGYIAEIISNYEQEQLDPLAIPRPQFQIRHWFNSNLDYIYFTVPSLVGILAMLITLTVTALSVARERELGTFDQLLVSPLSPLEILIGKTLPAVIIGITEGMLIWLIGTTVLGVPFIGSWLLLLVSLLIYVFSVVGIALFISSLCKTQQQAILGTFVFMTPAVTLSGYAAPVENMPSWLIPLTSLNPLKHFLITVKGIFLKDMPISDVWEHTWPLLVIGALTITLAGWFFTKRLD